MLQRKKLSIWTEDLDAIILRRWNDGESAGIIAQAHGLTRNAVVGRLSRIGAPKRSVPMTRIKSAPGPQRPPKPIPVPIAATETERTDYDASPALFDGKPLTIATASDRFCRWLHGVPTITAPLCGHPVAAGKVYCGHHAKRAYSPQHLANRSDKMAADAAYVASGIARTGLG